ncbi:MAG: tetratricopeptide repeat protein, partial [Candidatus Binatia bacterium]
MASEAALAVERGARFAWPNLDAPYYEDPSAAAERLALKSWRQGTLALPVPAPHGTPAALYLAADVTYLRTLLGLDEPLAAPRAYERALRTAPTFPDAARALVMLGLANLRLGFAPEADLAFARLVREQPESPYAPVATVGRSAALRVRRRFDEARAVLAPLAEHPPARLACDVLTERAALARATGAHEAAVVLDDATVRDCPRSVELASVIEGRAKSLLAVGRRAEARAVLAQGSGGLDPDVQARLLIRAADQAREDGDLEAARDALDRVIGLRVSAPMRITAQAHLARLDGLVGPDRAVEGLEHLAASVPAPALRAEVLGQAAETLADAGRFEVALVRLARASVGDGSGTGHLEPHRDAILARWIAHLAGTDDAIGIAT